MSPTTTSYHNEDETQEAGRSLVYAPHEGPTRPRKYRAESDAWSVGIIALGLNA